MNQSEPEALPKTITLLLFSAGGLDFGAPAAQIIKTVKGTTHASENHIRLPWAISPEKNEQISLVVNIIEEKEVLVPIDDIEEIATVSIADISPFPAIIEPFLLSKGLWGVLLRKGRFFFMVNFAEISQITC